MQINFTVPGTPVAKGRPKFSRRGNFVVAYTPEKTANFETLVRISYQQANPGVWLEGQIGADIIAYFPIPKSTSKKDREKMLEGKIMHTKKSDLDNIVKAVADALNEIAYHDDSSICLLHAAKYYSYQPRVEVKLWEISNEETPEICTKSM